ncbi:MAG: rRNA maturation RNase YbeY [Candidatus Paceibacterota bacterium]
MPFVRIKNEILGKEYSLSIVFVDIKTIESLSKQFKGNKDHKNILSFPLDKDTGEIILNLGTIRTEAKNFDKKYLEYLGFLVIHGMLHLKGMTHGSKMEARKVCKDVSSLIFSLF